MRKTVCSWVPLLFDLGWLRPVALHQVAEIVGNRPAFRFGRRDFRAGLAGHRQSNRHCLLLWNILFLDHPADVLTYGGGAFTFNQRHVSLSRPASLPSGCRAAIRIAARRSRAPA